MTNINPDHVAEFITLVRKMRTAQKHYFTARDNLGECKKIERQVDAWLASEKWGKYPLFDEEAN